MELEEAIEILNNMRSWDCRETDSKCVEAIEIVLSELDSLKFKYQVRKDRTNTIIKKQEKMIELMAEKVKHIVFVDEKNKACFFGNKEEVKQYFEKKAEEAE